MKGNDLVRLVLESRLHGLMGNAMLITLTGRKTGRQVTVPANYYRDFDVLWMITSRSRIWWRNLRHGAQVRVHLQGKDLNGFAEAVLDEKAVAAQIGEYVRHLPMSAKALGVRIQDGIANCEDSARLAKERLFVRICL